MCDTLVQRKQAGCTDVNDDVDLSAANLGLVASYYSLRYTTVEMFARYLY